MCRALLELLPAAPGGRHTAFNAAIVFFPSLAVTVFIVAIYRPTRHSLYRKRFMSPGLALFYYYYCCIWRNFSRTWSKFSPVCFGKSASLFRVVYFFLNNMNRGRFVFIDYTCFPLNEFYINLFIKVSLGFLT